MKHEWAAYVAFWVCVALIGSLFLHYKFQFDIEVEKTKQMELKLDCKG